MRHALGVGAEHGSDGVHFGRWRQGCGGQTFEAGDGWQALGFKALVEAAQAEDIGGVDGPELDADQHFTLAG